MKKMQRNPTKKSHSWWWDSHINPKNSKWLAENLEKMDAQVKEMLKLIEEEGDSFAKKAEMYYQRRPMLIDHVENFYRMYRALAERYDHVTGELRKNIPSSMQSQCSDDVSGSDSEIDEAQDEHEIENDNENNISYLLNQRNIELEAELQEAREKLSALEEKNTRCQCACGDIPNLKLSELEEKMQASQSQILNLQKDLEEKTRSFESLKEVINEKEAEVSATKNKSETLEEAMAHENLADELKKLSEANASLENKMASMEAQLKQAEVEKAEASTESGKQLYELNQDIASLKSKLELLSSEKAEGERRKPKQFLGWMPRCCITAAPVPLVQSTSPKVPKYP